MELATEDGIPGEARGVGGGIQRTGDDERDKGEDEDRERAGDCAWWATAVKGAKEGRRRAKLLEALERTSVAVSGRGSQGKAADERGSSSSYFRNIVKRKRYVQHRPSAARKK